MGEGQSRAGRVVEQRDMLLLAGTCIDCDHPTSSITVRGVLEAQADHDARVHAERPKTGLSMRAVVSTKTVRLEVNERAS